MLLIKDQIDTRLPKGDMSGIKLRDVRWSVKTAGPSPFDNDRTEIFLLGCNKAMSGNACRGCFNSSTWDSSKAEWTHDPVLMAQHINNNAPHKYVTIGGGEPTDQIDNLIILCRELKKYGFHIMIYTWREVKELLKAPIPKNFIPCNPDPKDYSLAWKELREKFNELIEYVDIIVDGQYKEEERLWNGDKGDGLISSVGSGNQIIWNINKRHGFSMRDIDYLWINPKTNDLLYIVKDLECETHLLKI